MDRGDTRPTHMNVGSPIGRWVHGSLAVAPFTISINMDVTHSLFKHVVNPMVTQPVYH
jgi:hypothetical protein